MNNKPEIKLKRATTADAEELFRMQTKSFEQMFQKYRDSETSPAKEPLMNIMRKLQNKSTYFYFIIAGKEKVGAIRIIDAKNENYKRISPLFILPEYRRRGFACAAIRACEEIHGHDNWTLTTILEEEGNLRLYEKMGYRRTGEPEKPNENMTFIKYTK